MVDKTVVKVLQAGLASIMGGGVGASNAWDVQEMWDAQETQDTRETQDAQEMQDEREMQDEQVDEEG